MPIGVSKNLASCHPWKPVRLMHSEWPPDAQICVQSTGAGTTLPYGTSPTLLQWIS